MQEADLDAAVGTFLAMRPYYPCCLLVHPDVLRLRRAADAVCEHYGWPELSIGTLLGDALLPLDPLRRPAEVQRILAAALHPHAAEPVLCTDIDLLFEQDLRLDPLLLLRGLSRGATLVVTWPGTVSESTLAYATPRHVHFRTWPRQELCVACVIDLS